MNCGEKSSSEKRSREKSSREKSSREKSGGGNKNNQQTRLGIITDTHFWPGSPHQYGADGEQLQPWSDLIFETILAEVGKNRLDFLFHLGDYTCGGGFFEMPDDQFFETLARTDQQLRQLDAAYFGLPGNHDCPVGTSTYTFAEEQFGLAPGLGFTVDTPHLRVVGVNSVGYTPQQKLAALPHDPVFGWLTDAEIQRVEGALASAGDLPVALFCHQLLRPWAGPAPWSPMYQIHNGDEILGLMEQHGNVRAVFQGHAHLYDVHTEPFAGQDVTFVVCPPAICYPLGWLLLTASAGELRVQYQPLPLDELRSHSNAQGQQAWRKPSDEWDDLRIPLT